MHVRKGIADQIDTFYVYHLLHSASVHDYYVVTHENHVLIGPVTEFGRVPHIILSHEFLKISSFNQFVIHECTPNRHVLKTRNEHKNNYYCSSRMLLVLYSDSFVNIVLFIILCVSCYFRVIMSTCAHF